MIIITEEYQHRETIPRVAACTQSNDETRHKLSRFSSIFDTIDTDLICSTTLDMYVQRLCYRTKKIDRFQGKRLSTSRSLNFCMNLPTPLIDQHLNVR